MRNIIPTLIASCILFGGRTAESQGTNQPLMFYIVTDLQEPGKLLVENLPAEPKTGFISSKPDLVLTNINKVIPEPGAFEAPRVHGSPIGLTIMVCPEDVSRFTELCTRAGGRVLLIKMGGETLQAPRTSNSAPRVDRFSLTFPSQEFDRRLDEIKRLVKAHGG
jgi:hypothetical protein